MVNPIVGTMCLTKVMMDGDSSLNILYASTLDKMGIPRSSLHPSKTPYYGIMPGKEAMPLGRIQLNITFGQPDNFRKEPLTLEVVDFLSVYHALLGRSFFTKFMAIPNDTYLKLKMSSPNGVITIKGSFEQAYYYEEDCIAQAYYYEQAYYCDVGRALAEEATKAAVLLDQPSFGKAIKTSGSSGGSTNPSIQALGPLEGVDPIEVRFDLSP
jgi:hypothetical protein